MVVDQSAAFKKTIGYPKHKIKKIDKANVF